MITFTPLTQHDGVHVRFDGIGDSFRFRLGNGKFGQLPHEGHFMFTIEGASGHYLVQLLHREYMAPGGAPAPTDILKWYLSTEVKYETTHAGALPLEKEWLNVLDHPYGAPILSWLRRLPGEHERKPGTTPATRYSVHAALLHSPSHLVDFVVTGLDADLWTERDLQTQAVRIASSYSALVVSGMQ